MEIPGLTEGVLIQERYRLARKLGAGGMGEVWEAHHPLLHKNRYAIKFLFGYGQESEQFERFSREAKILARLEHNNITKIHDYKLDHTPPYIVLEYLEGEPLNERLARARLQGSGLPINEVTHIMKQVSDALAVTHHEGIIHRDLKPENIYLCRSDESGLPIVKILDFGVSKMSGEQQITLHQQGFLGTPQYMSPEQALGNENVDQNADQFSLGIILYEMLSGELPFQGEQIVQIATQIVHGDPPYIRELVPLLPELAAQALHRALCKSPDDRFPSCKEFIDTFIHGTQQASEEDEWAMDSQTEIGVRDSIISGVAPFIAHPVEAQQVHYHQPETSNEQHEGGPSTIKMNFKPEFYGVNVEGNQHPSRPMEQVLQPPSIQFQPHSASDPALFPNMAVEPYHHQQKALSSKSIQPKQVWLISLIVFLVIVAIFAFQPSKPTFEERAKVLNQTKQIKGSLILPQVSRHLKTISLLNNFNRTKKKSLKRTKRLPPHQRLIKLGKAIFLLASASNSNAHQFINQLEIHWFGPRNQHFVHQAKALPKGLHQDMFWQVSHQFTRSEIGRWVILVTSDGDIVAELPFEVMP